MEEKLYSAASDGREEEVRKILKENQGDQCQLERFQMAGQPFTQLATMAMTRLSPCCWPILILMSIRRTMMEILPSCGLYQWKDQLCSIAAQGCQGQGQ